MFKFVQKKSEKTDYIVGREWAELKKTWEKFESVKLEQNTEKMNQYALKINNLQKKLGITKTKF